MALLVGLSPAGASAAVDVTDPAAVVRAPELQPPPPAAPAGGLAVQGFDPTRSRVDESKTSATRREWVNPDGTRTTEVAAGPVRFRDGAGAWQELDLSLARDASGRAAGRKVPDGTPVIAGRARGRLAVLGAPGRQFVLSHPDAVDVEGRGRDGDRKLSFPGGLSGGRELRVGLVPGGIEEEVVLPSAASSASYQLRIELPAGTTARSAPVGVEFVDGRDVVRLVAGHGVAFDAAEPAVESPVTARLVSADASVAVVEFGVSPSWLAAPERVFPVTLDPSVWDPTVANGNACGTSFDSYAACDTYVNSDAPYAAYHGQRELRAGSPGGQEAGAPSGTMNRTRTFIQFATDSYFNSRAQFGTEVLSASFKIYNYASDSPASTRPFTAYALTSRMGSDTTWAAQPGILSSPAAPSSADGSYSGAVQSFAFQNGFVTFNALSAARDWVNGVRLPYGFAVVAGRHTSTASAVGGGAERDRTYFRKFYSGETGFDLSPRLTLTTDRPPPVASNVSPSPDSVVPDGSPTLQVRTGFDPDGDPVQFYFRVLDASGAIAADSGWLSSKSWQVPAGRLGAGQRYTWFAYTGDGRRTTTPPTADNTAFTVNSAPQAAAPVSPGDGEVVAGSSTELVVNPAADPQGQGVSYRFETSTSSGFESLSADSGFVTSTRFAVSAAAGTRLFWRVATRDSQGATTGPAFVRSFTFNSAPQAAAPVSPGDGEVVAGSSTELVVNPAADPQGQGVSYRFETSTSSGFESLSADSGFVTATRFAVSAAAGTRLFWRVATRDSQGATTGSAFVRSFTFNSAPQAAVPVSPGEGQVVAGPSSELVVNPAADPQGQGVSYRFETSTSSGFESLSADSGFVTSTRFAVSAAAGTRLFWRVATRDSQGATTGSAFVRSFTFNSAPQAAAPVSPGDGEVVPSTSPQLTVSVASDPQGQSVSYRFEVSTVNTFASLTADSGFAAGTAFTVPAGRLTPGSRYFWRVSTRDSQGATTGSSFLRSFVVNSAPAAAAALSPADGDTVPTATPRLSVAVGSDPQGQSVAYRFEMSTTSSFTSLTADSGFAARTTYDVPAGRLSDGARYFWRVSTRDSQGATTGPAFVRSFIVNSAPGAAAPLSPGDRAVIASATPDLSVSAASDPQGQQVSYRFEISTSSTFASLTFDSTFQTKTIYRVPAGTLIPGATYFWRVATRDSQGAVTGSSFVWSFTVNSAPAAAAPGSPADKSTVTTSTPDLVVKPATDPQGQTVAYRFEVSTSSTFATLTSDSGFVTGTTYRVPAGRLPDGGPYWWRVSTRDSQGATTGSSFVRSFTVDTARVPDAPAAVTAVAAPGQIGIDWTRPVADGGAPLLSYDVELIDPADGRVVASRQVPADPAAGTQSAMFVGLENGVALFSRVRAVNRKGPGPSRDSGTVTPLIPLALTKTADVTGSVGAGDVVNYTLTVTNSNARPVRNITVEDVPDLGISPVLSRVDGKPVCSSILACAFDLLVAPDGAQSMVLKIAELPVGDTRFTYPMQVGSGTAACQRLSNTASVTDAIGTRPMASPAVSLLSCDTGLGLEPWWTSETTEVGPQAALSVNVANGNAVLQATDTTPVQAHGRLAYALRRTYNSQARPVATLPGSLGAGWAFNFGETDDGGVGTTGTSLHVPSLGDAVDTVLNPLGVTLVDRDGTRHRFTPRSAGVSIGVAGLTGAAEVLKPTALPAGGGTVCVDVAYTAPKGVHLGLWRYVKLGAGSDCGNVTRGDQPVVIGYAAIRPDRLRTEYDVLGRLVSMTDPNGVELRHLYGADVLRQDVNRLTAVYEPRSCRPGGAEPTTVAQIPPTCRAFRFDYTRSAPTDGAVASITVTDPAHRPTVYELDRALTTDPTQPIAHLSRVVDPDGGSTGYSYGGCGGTADQLCSITDRRGSTTRLDYAAAGPAGSPPPLSRVTDRRGTATDYSYGNGSTTVTTLNTPGTASGGLLSAAEQATPGQSSVYSGIDTDGRVAVSEDWTANPGGPLTERLHRTRFSWDTGCRQPEGKDDNNLCAVERDAAGTAADGRAVTDAVGKERTEYLYNNEGATLRERAVLGAGSNLDTTWGYRTQYVNPSGPAALSDDTVAGAGQLTVGARPDPDTSLFSVTDKTQQLTRRGNAPGAAVAAHLTTWVLDNNPSRPVSAAPAPLDPARPAGPATCATPTGGADQPNTTPTAVANTGNMCETRAPGSAPDGAQSLSRATYDSFGQRLTSTTAKAIARSGPQAQPAATRYVYFADDALDISGTVTAGGWLRHVVDVTSPATDPDGAGYNPDTDHFVAFDYDAAGNTVRTWDRDATRRRARDSYPGPLTVSRSGPPGNPDAAQSFFAADSGQAGFARPWRYALETVTPAGNRTRLTVDANGNVQRLTPPRGTAAGNDRFDTLSGYDRGGLLTDTSTPLQREQSTSTRYGYDAFGNRTSQRAPREGGESDRHVTVWRFDAANRTTATLTSRGPAAVDGRCRPAGDQDAPIPAGRTLCTSTVDYDHVDNPVRVVDANGETRTGGYDAVHRVVEQKAPRARGQAPTLTTRVNYDPDGNALDVCAPREFTDGSKSCTAASRHAVHTVYDPAGRATSRSTYRDDTSPANTTRLTYDPDGNTTGSTDPRGTAPDGVSVTVTGEYDLQGRRTSTSTPRAGRTDYLYTPGGDLLAVAEPGAASDNTGGPPVRITGYRHDPQHRLLDTVTALQATAFTDTAVRDAIAGAVTDSARQVNLRTRLDYDPDSRVAAVYPPKAFTTPGGQGSAALLAVPDPRHAQRTDFDRDGRPAVQYSPRTDGGPDYDDGTADSTQGGQCRTGAPGYPASVGVCRTGWSYDALGNVLSVQLPTRRTDSDAARTVGYSWTDDNLLEAVQAPDPAGTGRITAVRNGYDGTGQLRLKTNAADHTTTTDYTADGLVSAVRGPQGPGGLTHDTLTDYDANGQPVTVSTPRSLYDANGAVTGTQTPITVTGYYHDGLVKSVTTGRTADGTGGTGDNTTSYSYDKAGNPQQVWSPEATAVRGGAVSLSNPAGAPTQYTYTADSLLAQTVQPVVTGAVTQSRRTAYGYDGAGRKTTTAVALLDSVGNAAGESTQRLAYYPSDLLKTQTGRSGQTIGHVYNAGGQQTSVLDSTGGGVDITGDYYLDGLPRTVTSQGRSTSYAYDGARTVTARQHGPTAGGGGGTDTTRFTVNDAGLPTAMSEPDGAGDTGWAYDTLGRAVSETRPNGTAQQWQYRADELLGSTTVTAGTVQRARWEYDYDELGRIRAQSHTGQAAAPQHRVGTARGSGPAGQEGDTTAAVAYRTGYDAAGRLASFTDARGLRSLAYDRNSNRLAYGQAGQPDPSSWTYRADDSIATSRTTERHGGPLAAALAVDRTFGYAPFGGVTSDGCSSYAYDGFDRLERAERDGALSNTCTAPNVSYGYDGLDRQTSRSQDAADGVAAETARMSYDGWDSTVQHESVTGGVSPGELGYTLDADGGARTARSSPAVGASVVEFLAEDGTGSTGLVTDGAGGVRCQARYDAYGQPDANTTTTAPPPGQCASGLSAADVFYRGDRKDPTTGQYQLGSRTYDPAKASFLTPDSYRTGGSAASTSLGVDPLTRNSYSYVNGDPINLSDPTGHWPKKWKKRGFFNAVMGGGKGLWSIGPGAVGDIAGWIPTDATRKFDRRTDRAQQRLQDWSGADADSSAFKATNTAVQVVSIAIGGAGAVRAVISAAKTAPALARTIASAGKPAASAAKPAASAAKPAASTGRRTLAESGGGVRAGAEGIKTGASKVNNAVKERAETVKARMPRGDTGSISIGRGTPRTGGAAEAGDDTVRVGRWMRDDEFAEMTQSGRVVERGGGRTYVTNPANPDAYPAGKGLYAEFNVPGSSVFPAGKPEWGVIPGPNVTTRIYGPPPPQMPSATCIVLVCRR